MNGQATTGLWRTLHTTALRLSTIGEVYIQVTIQRTVVPLGEFAPDIGDFGNPSGRLRVCRNLAPVYTNYCPAPAWIFRTLALTGTARGLHALSTGPGTFLAFMGDDTDLYKITPTASYPWTMASATRTVGGAYNTAGAGGENGWQFTGFGRNEIATNYVDDAQLLLPGAANFVKLVQSGAGVGMDPKAKFVGPLRNNLFLANCNLPLLYDGLAAGAHPNLVVWSQTENIRQFGSFNADPQLIGSGYQEILNDFGDITGFLGGDDFAIVAQERAFVRIDGPPYQFRAIVTGTGTRFPNALRRFGDDIYGWGPGGLFVLRGGEGPIVYLGDGKLVRTLIDNATSFSLTDSILPGIDVKAVSLAIDPTNRLLQCVITSRGRQSILGTDQEGDLTIWYNIPEDRFSFADSWTTRVIISEPVLSGVLYLCNRPDTAESWVPGVNSLAVLRTIAADGSVTEAIGTPILETEQTTKYFPRVRKPYIQLDPKLTTRILRVRPIYSSSVALSVTSKVTLYSKNRPYDLPYMSGPYSTTDTHGSIVTPTSVFADYHSIDIEIGAGSENTSNINQFSDIEVWFETGGEYAA